LRLSVQHLRLLGLIEALGPGAAAASPAFLATALSLDADTVAGLLVDLDAAGMDVPLPRRPRWATTRSGCAAPPGSAATRPGTPGRGIAPRRTQTTRR
jgi:hypothetical protein